MHFFKGIFPLKSYCFDDAEKRFEYSCSLLASVAIADFANDNCFANGTFRAIIRRRNCRIYDEVEEVASMFLADAITECAYTFVFEVERAKGVYSCKQTLKILHCCVRYKTFSFVKDTFQPTVHCLGFFIILGKPF